MDNPSWKPHQKGPRWLEEEWKPEATRPEADTPGGVLRGPAGGGAREAS